MSEARCSQCGSPLLEAQATCGTCGVALGALVDRSHPSQPTRAKASFAHWYSVSPGKELTTAGKIGLVLGLLVGAAMVVTMTVFVFAVGESADWSQAFLGLPLFGVGCIVLALVLGIGAGISLFFTSFGLGFCYIIGASSLVGAGVLAFLPDGGWAAAVVCLILVVEIVICWCILRAVSSRMVRRRAEE
jgi:hypothetical protein